MYKEMVAIGVFTDNNQQVGIKQPDFNGGEQTVYIPVEQLDLLMKWLTEAKAELTSEQFSTIPNG